MGLDFKQINNKRDKLRELLNTGNNIIYSIGYNYYILIGNQLHDVTDGIKGLLSNDFGDMDDYNVEKVLSRDLNVNLMFIYVMEETVCIINEYIYTFNEDTNNRKLLGTFTKNK